MELLDGPDAGRLVRDRGPLAIGTAVRVVLHALAALGYAHNAGFVHRDVKPANLLCGRTPAGRRTVKLADFGLARAYETAQLSGLTLNGDIGGTSAFMAPEQVTHYRIVSPAADQYSAAATLYHLLTACYLFDFPSDVGDKLRLVLTADPVPVRDRRPDVPAGRATAIHRGMAREPSDLYPDAAAFHAALAPFAGAK